MMDLKREERSKMAKYLGMDVPPKGLLDPSLRTGGGFKLGNFSNVLSNGRGVSGRRGIVPGGLPIDYPMRKMVEARRRTRKK